MSGKELPKVEDTIRLRGRYHVNIAVPAPIRTRWGGQAIYRKSLKTSDPATARKEAGAIRAIMNAQLDQAKAEEGWQALARNLPADQRALLDRAGGLSGLLKQFEAGKAALAFMEAGKPADAGGVEVDTGPNDAPVMVVTGNEADPEELQVELAAHHAASDTIRAQTNARGRVLGRLGQDVELAGDVHTLRDLIEDWAPGVDSHTADNARAYVKRFTELHGEIGLADLTGDHLRQFTDAIKGLPKVQSGKRRKMTLQQLTADAKRTGAETIGFATQRKYFDMLKGLMAHAVGRGYLTENPWGGLRLVKPKAKHSAPRPRRPFTAEEVRRILDYVRSSNDPVYGESTIDHWAPWIAAYHGLRIQEVCQLRTADFAERDGVWSMRITDEGEGQRVKNRNTVRWVPVHPKLIAAGLRGVVEARPANAFAFNEWARYKKRLVEMKPDERGRVSGDYGKRFGRLLRDKVGIKDPAAVFHSFRHRLADAADNVGIPDSHRRYLTGRANADAVEGAYGRGAAMTYLFDSLAKIDPVAA